MEDSSEKIEPPSDVEIMEQCAALVEKALSSFKRDKRKHINFTQDQVEVIYKCLVLGVNRTNLLNKLQTSIHSRDLALVSSLQEIEAFTQPLEHFRQSLINLIKLSKFFLNKE